MAESNSKNPLIPSGLARFIAVGAMLMAFYGLTRLARHAVPAGQPQLARLDAGNFHVLTDRFNSGSDRTRVLVMLSPT